MKRAQKYLPSWFSTSKENHETDDPNVVSGHGKLPDSGSANVDLAKESLNQLLDDTRVPDSVRNVLRDEYQQLRSMLNKLEHGHLHIAVFGRVSVGKSSVLNALLGKQAFSVSVLHGETKSEGIAEWQEVDAGGVYLIDTPGINEIDGEAQRKISA